MKKTRCKLAFITLISIILLNLSPVYANFSLESMLPEVVKITIINVDDTIKDVKVFSLPDDSFRGVIYNRGNTGQIEDLDNDKVLSKIPKYDNNSVFTEYHKDTDYFLIESYYYYNISEEINSNYIKYNTKDKQVVVEINNINKLPQIDYLGLRLIKSNGEKIDLFCGDIDINFREGTTPPKNLITAKAVDYNTGDLVYDTADLTYYSEDFDIDKDMKEELAEYSTPQNILYYIQIIGLIMFAIVITICVELIIAKIMKINSYKVIILTNLLTQSILHILTLICAYIFNFNHITITLIVASLEVLVIISEYSIYKRCIDIDKKIILKYVILANIVTYGLSLIIGII